MDQTAVFVGLVRQLAGQGVQTFDEKIASQLGHKSTGITQEEIVALCRTVFERETRLVSIRLGQAQEEILNVIQAYTDVNGYTSGNQKLSEEDRDSFDAHFAKVLREEQTNVDQWRAKVQEYGHGSEGSAVAHKQVVVQCLYERLQRLTKMTSELQLLRMRQTLSSRKSLFSELDPSLSSTLEKIVEKEQNEPSSLRRRRVALEENGNSREHIGSGDGWTAQMADHNDDDDFFFGEEDEFDAATVLKLEAEQVALKAQLDEEMQGIKMAEKQMREFSQLAAIFSEKLVEQSENINSIFKDVQTSTDFMDKSVDELISAKQHNASFRRNVIIFFAVASGLLLVMDWMD